MSIIELDLAIQKRMRHIGEPAARISLFIIFVWFGILKPLGVSAAEPLVLKTVDWMPLLTENQRDALVEILEILKHHPDFCEQPKQLDDQVSRLIASAEDAE